MLGSDGDKKAPSDNRDVAALSSKRPRKVRTSLYGPTKHFNRVRRLFCNKN